MGLDRLGQGIDFMGLFTRWDMAWSFWVLTELVVLDRVGLGIEWVGLTIWNRAWNL